MRNLDDVIRYENESSSLDFKADQYTKTQHTALIKDVMAMANADTKDERLIIIGVKHKPDGQREILGILNLVDASTYQQLIFENIEPPLKIDYVPHHINDRLVGIIRLSDCSDQPYVMKKDFVSLKRGEGFIRKGTHQARLDRRDLDRIYEAKRSGFDGTVKVTFSDSDGKEIELSALRKYKPPSQRIKERIQAILDGRKSRIPVVDERFHSLARALRSPLEPVPYEARTTDELEKALAEVDEDFKEDDAYDFFERRAHKINLRLLNEGKQYVEDASIRLTFQSVSGLNVAETLYAPPRKGGIMLYVPPTHIPYMDYPEVHISDGEVHVFADVGDLRHGIPTDAFREPVRLVLTEEAVGQSLHIRCEILAKNLRTPLSDDLVIHVT